MRTYKRPSAGRNIHAQVTPILSSTQEQPQQPTPCVATTETTMVASAVEATAMEAWAVAMAPATALASAGWAVAMAVATAMALALATTIEDAMEDSHPPIFQFWTPKFSASPSDDAQHYRLLI